MERVELVPYDHRWPPAFEQEAELLREGLGEEAVIDIQHVGSTAVPGLSAKPIIDMLVMVPDLEAARARMPARLDVLGYDFWADNPDRARLFFVKGKPPRGAKRTHHVHVVKPDSEGRERHILFRDYLRAHPGEAANYQALKLGLAAQFAQDREAYTDAKTDFINRIVTLARA